MLNLISKSTTHFTTTVKHGIIRRLRPIKLERQSNSLLGTDHLKIYTLMTWNFYLTEPSKIFFQTTFHMELSSVMTKINLGLIIKSRS